MQVLLRAENTICFVFWVNSTTQAVTCANVVHYEALMKILFTLKPDNGHFLQGWHPAIFAHIFKRFFTNKYRYVQQNQFYRNITFLYHLPECPNRTYPAR